MCAFRKMPAALCLSLLCCFALSCFKKQDNTITGAGEPLFTLVGKVVDIDNSRAVQGAIVQIKALGLSDTVDASGTYRLTNLKVGTRVLEISAPRYAPAAVNVALQYEQREVVQDIAMTKLLEVVNSGTLPFTNASGIWWEEGRLVITNFDSLGGRLFRLDENFNLLQISPRIGTLPATSCFVRVDTCFWKQGRCERFIDPQNPFTPDSITTFPVFVDCQQRLYGLTRAGDFFYTTDGRGHHTGVGSLTPIHVFKIDPQTLAPVETLTLGYSISGYALKFITDLAWDGTGIWLCNRELNNLPKVNAGDFSLRAVFAGPLSSMTGLTWDGRYMWISSATEVVQFDVNRGIRNHYKSPNLSNDYIAWDGKYLWAVRGSSRQIYKLAIPFEDHL